MQKMLAKFFLTVEKIQTATGIYQLEDVL